MTLDWVEMEIERVWAKFPGWFDEQSEEVKLTLIGHFLANKG